VPLRRREDFLARFSVSAAAGVAVSTRPLSVAVPVAIPVVPRPVVPVAVMVATAAVWVVADWDGDQTTQEQGTDQRVAHVHFRTKTSWPNTW